MTEPGGRASPRAARVATGAASRGGVEGDGWDDEFQFTPRADASPRSSGKRTPPRSPRGGAPAGGSTRILFYPTRPRGDDAHSPASSSGTSRGSPDENQNASQIPGSSGRRRSFTDGFTPPSADPNASPPAPNRVSVSPFEQRRRQALLEKQRRFEEMIGRIRAPDSPEQPPPATATTTPRRLARILPRDEDETSPAAAAAAAAAVDVSTDSDAWTPVSHRDRQSGTPVGDSWDEIEAPAVTPPGARRRRPPGDDPSSPSSSLMRTPAEEPLELSPDDVTSGGTGRRLSEDELVARYRVFARNDDDDDDDDGGARRAAEPNPPSWPFSRNPSGGSDVQAAAFSPRELAGMAPSARAESPTGDAPTVGELDGGASPMGAIRPRSARPSPAKSPPPPDHPSPAKSPPPPDRPPPHPRPPSIELPRDDSMSSGGFATPRGATPTSGGGARIEITTEEEEDGDGDGERVESRNTPERAPSSPTTAESEAIVGRSRVPLTSRAAKFMATLGAARRGTAEDRADIRRRLGLPEVDEGARRSFEEEEEEEEEEEREGEAGPYARRSPDRKPRSLAGSWLSDSAAAAAAAAAAPRLGAPRSPSMPSIREEPRDRPGSPAVSSPAHPRGDDVAYSPANSTPTPPRTPMRRFQNERPDGETPTRRYPGPMAAKPPRSPAGANDADKAAAARKLLAAASPSKQPTLVHRGGSVTTSVTSSPAPRDGSPGGHDPGKAAAARRIMLAAAAKKAAAGADDGSGSLAGDDEEFGLDLVFSPASAAKATAATASGGGGGGGGGAAGGAIAERAVPAQRQLGFAESGFPEPGASDSGNESAAGVYDSAFEFRSPRRHEAEVRARMARLNEVPPPPSVAPASHRAAEVSRVPRGDAAKNDDRRDDEDGLQATATDYETDAGYGTAMDSLPASGTSGDASNPRALRVALEKLEMRLEESGWEKEALETRLAEAEATLARTDAVNGARISQLSAEVQQNDYLRRLLKRAEETRNAARMQAKEARVRLEIRERELESRQIEIDRMEAERDGLRRRILTEKRRSEAMERTIEAQNDELEESHGRRVTMTQLAGLLVCFLVILWMRIRYGPREIPVVEPPPPSNIRTIEFGRRVGTHTPLRKPDP